MNKVFLGVSSLSLILMALSAGGDTESKKDKRIPASQVYLETVGKMPNGTIVRVWDAENKVLCFAASGDYYSGGGGSGASISCIQK